VRVRNNIYMLSISSDRAKEKKKEDKPTRQNSDTDPYTEGKAAI